MINRSFLLPPNEDGSRQRALITGVVEDFQGQLNSDPDRVRYKARIGESKFEELIEYNDLMEMIEEQKPNDDGTWRFRKIMAHREPKNKKDTWKVLVEWESGERSWEPIKNIFTGDRYILAEYA